MYRAKSNIWDMDYTDNYEKVCCIMFFIVLSYE